MTTPEIIQQRLRSLGIGNWLTLSGWCKREGLNYKSTWRWLQNPDRSNVATARRICKKLGITLNDLYGD